MTQNNGHSNKVKQAMQSLSLFFLNKFIIVIWQDPQALMQKDLKVKPQTTNQR